MFPKQRTVYFRIMSAWLIIIALSVPVYYFGMPGGSIADALLESAASWTATGIGAYDASSMPLWLSLFRSVSVWIGGVGIIMLFLTILHPRRTMGWSYAASEFPGPSFLKTDTEFRMNYRRIVTIYAALTVLQFVILMAAGMPAPDALMSALSNTASGGLHHIGNGVVHTLSMPVKAVLTVFAFAGSVNSLLFVYILRRKWKFIKTSSELKVYISQILISTLLITGIIAFKGSFSNIGAEACSVFMQVVSSLSTSGYIIADVSKWPALCRDILLLEIFIGACSLSTGGGIKTGRVIIAVKTTFYTLYRHVHPNSVRTLTFNQKPLKSDHVVSANIFVALFMMTYLAGALLLSLDNVGLSEALYYSQAMITNSGISIGSLDHAGLAAPFSAYGRVVLSVIMIAGRLEIYPLLMLFFRGFWRAE